MTAAMTSHRKESLAGLPKSNSRQLNELESFLRGVFVRGPCEKIDLRHKVPQGTTRIRDWLLSDLTIDERAPETLAGLIYDAAQTDANGLNGVGQYGVFVFRPGETEHVARLILQLRSETNTYGDGSEILGETEPPNATGLVSQSQRHTEGMARLLISGMGVAMQAQARAFAILEAQNARMSEREERVLAREDKLREAEHMYKLEVIRETSKANRQERMLDKVDMLAPILIGKAMPSAKDKMLIESTRQLMKSLTPTQFGKLIEEFSPEQQATMMTIYQTFLKEEEAKEQKQAASEKEADKL